MRKIIKRKIHISTHKRDLIDFINDEFYSHDKHNAFIEFTMKSLPTDNIIALFYFQKTKRYVETKAFVDGDKFTIEFDTSLITADETVLGFIYFEKVAQSADVHRFSFGVKVSEIDKLHDIPIQEQSTKRVVAIEDIVTKPELDELFKRIEKNGGTYDDTEIRNSISSISERVQTLETKPDNNTVYDDSELSRRVSALETKEDKDTVYNDEEIKRRLSNLEGKTDNFISGVSVNKEGNNVTLTYNYVDGQTKNVSFTDSDTINIAYDDSALKSRLNDLENRPQVESYNDADIKKRLSELEAKPTVDVSEYAKKSEVPTTDSVTNLLRTQGEQANKIQLLETKAGYEIHGTGMPNGKVTAPIGTTYIDTEVTNGALKWIKQTGSDNNGWKVIHGDTGWRNLKIVSQYGNSYVKIRRINNNVMYHFGSLENGYFGTLGRNDVGVVRVKGNEIKEILIVNVDGIPQGFRTENYVVGTIHNIVGYPRGIYHVRGTSDGNFLSFRNNGNWPNNPQIYDLMINLNYFTEDEWPTELPTV